MIADYAAMRRVTEGAAVVLLSGGQDSTTCLAWALERFARIECVTIDYGQRHRVELDAAVRVAAAAGVPQVCIPCDSFSALGGNSLTTSTAVETALDPETGLPNTFVPGRNLVFLTLAASFAWQRGIADLVTGVCQTDYSGYPDCRADTMEALQTALRAGMDFPLNIHTPLMHLTKAETVVMLRDLGHLDLLKQSHTCYNGQIPPCGQCPACVLRAKGFAEAGIPDPLMGP
jgi:7-cyano-7-deazaguanine synthase